MSSGCKRIVEAGHDAQGCNRINEHTVKSPQVVIGISRFQDHQKDQHNFRSRGELSIDTGRKRPIPGNQQDHDRHNKDQHVPAEDEDGKPPRQLVFERKNDKRRRKQQFVGDRIEVRAKRRSLIQAAGQQTIDAVREPGDNKNQQRPSVAVISNQNQKNRQEAEAQKSNLIGNRSDAAFHCDSG